MFARDLYEAFAGLLVAGDIRTARAATRFLLLRQQQPDGSMPRNSLLNGKVAPDTGGLQLDETSYPILMAWQSGLAGDGGLYRDHIVPAADFLVANGPSDGAERWEEQGGFSPSTISAEIAGLTAASAIAATNHDAAHARLYQATADQFARKIKAWTVTTSGTYGPRVLHPPVEDGRSQRRDQLRPRQRQHQRRPAPDRGPGVPGARATRRPAGLRP